jgi:hypothetical protein
MCSRRELMAGIWDVARRYKTDYWVVEEIFERSLRRALERQRKRCGDIWSQDKDTAGLR